MPNIGTLFCVHNLHVFICEVQLFHSERWQSSLFLIIELKQHHTSCTFMNTDDTARGRSNPERLEETHRETRLKQKTDRDTMMDET